MSTAELRLTLVADTDGTGEITATVKSDGFAGTGSAWFDIRQVQ